MLRVLLVAPRKSDLASVDAEVQDILSSGLVVDTLLGEVTASGLLRRIREGEYDVLWLATHGNSSYIELSGAERITAEELVPVVRGRFSLVVLNTCNSLRIAKMVQLQANVGVICSLVSTADTLAYKFGSLLSSALAEHPSVADAYLAAVTGNDETFLYLPALRPGPSAIEFISVQLDELNKRLARELLMWRWLFGGSAVLHLAELTFIGWLMWTRGG